MSRSDTNVRQLTVRSGLYKILSTAFLFPDESNLRGPAEVKDGRYPFPKDDVTKRLRSFVTEAGRSTREPALSRVAEDHDRLFGPASVTCPPYETDFTSGHLFMKTHQLADIAGFYRAFGLEPSSVQKERPDHLSVELEFMHFLVCKEAFAFEEGEDEKLNVCREAQAKFFGEHIAKWAVPFCRLLRDRAETQYYVKLASLTEAFISVEASLLRTPLTLDAVPEMPPGEPADTGCAACPANPVEG